MNARPTQAPSPNKKTLPPHPPPRVAVPGTFRPRLPRASREAPGAAGAGPVPGHGGGGAEALEDRQRLGSSDFSMSRFCFPFPPSPICFVLLPPTPDFSPIVLSDFWLLFFFFGDGWRW